MLAPTARARRARPVSGNVSVFGTRPANGERGWRGRARPAAAAIRIPRLAHEHAHANAAREPHGHTHARPLP